MPQLAVRPRPSRAHRRRGAAPLALAALLVAACAPAARRPAVAAPMPASVPVETPPPPAAHARVVPPTTGATHYVDQLLEAQQGRVVRWDRDPEAPIRVWVPPARGDARTLAFPAVLDTAMRAWNDVGLPAVFERAADSVGADVLVRWVRTERDAETAGRTNLRIDGRTDHIRSATLAIVTHASSGYPYAPAAVMAVALHELGHVLGLAHAGKYDCVMFPIPQRSTFCAADVESARRWYAMPAGVVAASQAAAQR